MTTSFIPAIANRSKCQTIKGLDPISNKGLGVSSVSGRIRSPLPAAKIMAFIKMCTLLLAQHPPIDRANVTWA